MGHFSSECFCTLLLLIIIYTNYKYCYVRMGKKCNKCHVHFKTFVECLHTLLEISWNFLENTVLCLFLHGSRLNAESVCYLYITTLWLKQLLVALIQLVTFNQWLLDLIRVVKRATANDSVNQIFGEWHQTFCLMPSKIFWDFFKNYFEYWQFFWERH